MDGDSLGPAADPPQPSAEPRRAKKRRRDSSPQEEIPAESSRSVRRHNLSQPTPPLPLHPFPPWHPSHPGDGTVPPALGPVSMIPYPYPPPTHHQPFFLTPSIVWPPMSTAPATPYTESVMRPTKDPAPSPSVNDDPASVPFEEQPGGVPSPINNSLESQQYSTSGATNRTPRLDDLPDPPAGQRPPQTILVLASAALRSEPKGKLGLEEIVDRICSRFEYFQDSQIRANLKVRLTFPIHNATLIEMVEKS
jgi:hypothetical protein